MSIETWKKQYYPIPASRCISANALGHSILKWTGATPAALKRHGLTSYQTDLRDDQGNSFRFNNYSCALCVRFDNCYFGPASENPCPVKLVIGDTCREEFLEWDDTGNAGPMLALLRRVKREVAKRGKVTKAV